MKSNMIHHRCKYGLRRFTSESYFSLGRHEMNSPHKKQHDEGTTGHISQHTSKRYSNHLLCLNDGSGDRRDSEKQRPSIAVDVYTAINEINGSRMPRISCPVMELGELLLRLAEMKYQSAASQDVRA